MSRFFTECARKKESAQFTFRSQIDTVRIWKNVCTARFPLISIHVGRFKFMNLNFYPYMEKICGSSGKCLRSAYTMMMMIIYYFLMLKD